MVTIAALVSGIGGMVQKRQLVALGVRDLDLTLAVKRGSVLRARQGWYTTLPADSAAVRAVRVGGRLTGLSMVAELGGWVLSRPKLHVSVPVNAGRLRSATNRFVHPGATSIRGVTLHWEPRDLAGRGTATAVDLLDALVRVVLDEDLETAVAALDWAMLTNRIDRIDFERILQQLPESRRWIRDWVDARCESLPESLARTRLRLAGHRVDSQVRLRGFERIDLVVDDVLGLEVDGAEHHRDRFEADRNKDLAITIAGLHALRPHARAVFSSWDVVERALNAALAARGIRVTPGGARLAFGNSGAKGDGARETPVLTRGRRTRSAFTPEFSKRRGPDGARRGGDGARRVGNTSEAGRLLSG